MLLIHVNGGSGRGGGSQSWIESGSESGIETYSPHIHKQTRVRCVVGTHRHGGCVIRVGLGLFMGGYDGNRGPRFNISPIRQVHTIHNRNRYTYIHTNENRETPRGRKRVVG